MTKRTPRLSSRWLVPGLLCVLSACGDEQAVPQAGNDGRSAPGASAGLEATPPAAGSLGSDREGVESPGTGGGLMGQGGGESRGAAMSLRPEAGGAPHDGSAAGTKAPGSAEVMAGGGVAEARGADVSATGGSASLGGMAGAGDLAGNGGNGGTSLGGAANVAVGGESLGGAANVAAGGAPGVAISGNGSQGGASATPDPVCVSSLPEEFEPNTSVGGGGERYTDSTHFRVYGNASPANVDSALNHLEAAFSCFVEDWCFRPTGLSIHSDDGPHTKMNIYTVGSLGGAGGVMQYDPRAGLPYLEVLNNQVARPQVTVHEWGHALTLTEYNWVEQGRTGAWWETVANWVADTYLTSTHCQAARERFGVAQGDSMIDLNRVIGESHLLIVSTQNYYEAWPFLTYLTSNPDGYAGLGKLAVQDLMRSHLRNNETPLHVLERIAAPVSVQEILGRYWARMAYLDIGHPRARDAFFDRRARLDFDSLQPMGNQSYQVKESRRPQYGGANIIPLKGTGDVRVQVTNSGNGLPESNFTATLSIRAADGAVRYVDLPNGTGQASVGDGEEASLVIVNTPDMLYQYDAFQTEANSPEAIGLNYQVQLSGALP